MLIRKAGKLVSKGNIILFAIILVLVLVIGLGVGWLIVSGSKAADAEKAKAEQGEQENVKKYELAKTTAIDLSKEPIISNLKTESVNEKRVIRVKAKLRVVNLKNEKQVKEIEENTSIIIDILLDILRSKTAEEMLKPEAKQQIKTETLEKVNKEFHTDKIVDMHFEDFIVQ